MVPIEIKSAISINQIDTGALEKFIKDHHTKFGIVIYLGEKHFDGIKRILYLPLWIF